MTRLAIVWVLLFPAISYRTALGNDRPNFVFLFADDQRYDAMSVVQKEQGEQGRYPWFQTPHMDRIASEGVRFRNAFVTLSLCSPSRAVYLTGRYNHLNGIANNRTPFPVDSVTVASELRKAGYTTGYVGKWHMGSQSGQRPGFDWSASYVGQSRFFDPVYEINGNPRATKGWVDDLSTDFAIDFMKSNREKPFLLMLGFKSPHGPTDPPDRAKDRFATGKARAVPNLNSPAIYKRSETGGNGPGAPKAANGDLVNVNLGYFRCVSAVDENVGRLLATLDELQLTANTVVIYTSDNGYYHGEHGLGDKRSGYDESLRIPMLLRYPKLGRGGIVRDEMVLNLDVAQTLLDFAGVPAPPTMQGRSWKPLLENQPVAWRDSFLFEYFREGRYPIPTLVGIRTTDAKYVKYPGHDDWTEAFDLKADPFELKNLANDPAETELRARLEMEFERQAKAVDFKIPDYADKDEPSLAATRLNQDVLDYTFAKDEGTRVTDGSGHGNHGTAKSVPLAQGRDGKAARRFDGKGHIEVPKSKTLDCSNGPWTVEATVRPDQPGGTIVARGGQQLGYALHLTDKGQPALTVRAGGRTITVVDPKPVVGAWVRLTGVLGADRKMKLYVDGVLAETKPLPDFLGKDPNDSMQIGADTGSQVQDQPPASPFVGLIERIRIFSGEQTIMP